MRSAHRKIVAAEDRPTAARISSSMYSGLDAVERRAEPAGGLALQPTMADGSAARQVPAGAKRRWRPCPGAGAESEPPGEGRPGDGKAVLISLFGAAQATAKAASPDAVEPGLRSARTSEASRRWTGPSESLPGRPSTARLARAVAEARNVRHHGLQATRQVRGLANVFDGLARRLWCGAAGQADTTTWRDAPPGSSAGNLVVDLKRPVFVE